MRREEAPRGWPPGFAAAPADRRALLVLAHLEGLTPRALCDLALRKGTASACLEAVRAAGAGSAADRTRIPTVDPGAVAARLEACGARLVAAGDAEYPERLLDLADPPAWLFVRGRRLHGWTGIAVVGARRCSSYGVEAAGAIGRGLGAAGVAVVSGAARGIDGAGHRGALAAGGHTIAVLGSGIDVPYPAGNRRLIEEIARTATLVSEYPPGFPAHARRFPARNRLVVALSRAVVVVEGAPGSGSMISVGFAEQLGRAVLAVPGPVSSPLSAVPHTLIREGAALVTNADDVLEHLHLEQALSGGGTDELSEQEIRVLAAIVGSGVTAEDVAASTGLPVPQTLAVLVGLELRGLVRTAGGRYERTMAGARIEVRQVPASGA